MEWTEPCYLDGCDVQVTITLRPDSRYRVSHGAEEGATTFLTKTELFTTKGYWPFVRTLHDEEGRPRLEDTMGQQALARMATLR